ncbi:MAG: addiction module antidote protein [Pseudomonadota bacterium]
MFAVRSAQCAEARLEGMSKLAEATGLNRESLYRMLSGKGDPELKSLDRLLHALGLKITVDVDEHAA